jgi:hypothetical protein
MTNEEAFLEEAVEVSRNGNLVVRVVSPNQMRERFGSVPGGAYFVENGERHVWVLFDSDYGYMLEVLYHEAGHARYDDIFGQPEGHWTEPERAEYNFRSEVFACCHALSEACGRNADALAHARRVVQKNACRSLPPDLDYVVKAAKHVMGTELYQRCLRSCEPLYH